jgi:LPS sulfotransferase NodH
MGAIQTAPWPRIEGCLAVLFTSRTGSTYLARELECHFDVGRMRESLNPVQVKGRPAAWIVAERQNLWFAFKAGPLGVIAGELYGFFDAYLDRTAFILLARKDIIAQAVSLEKAVQTQQWHSTDTPQRPAVYDGVRIANSIKNIVIGVEQLRLYAQHSGRPWRTLIYEDFSRGDFTPALTACAALGVPRRGADATVRSRRLERLGDANNDAWGTRFREDMDRVTQTWIERYGAAL